MKWRKIGQIFDFYKSPFPDRFVSHTQSPQVVIYEDWLRIFFSTRVLNGNGNYISDIQFVDMSKDLTKIVNYSDDTVISRGGLGCFDEHGIFPVSPLRLHNKIYAYTTGWTMRKSVPIETGIGLVISEDDGDSFKRIGSGPVLSSSLNEPFLVMDGFVRNFGNIFYMFYIFGQRWSDGGSGQNPERVYKIGYAVSNDGINWKKANKRIIDDKIDENECQALPTVIQIGNRFHMYFCYRHMMGFRNDKSKAYRIGYAYSDDLINWCRDDEKAGISTSENSWDSDMMCYPHIFELDGQIYLFYNGNEFGKYGFGAAILEGM